MSMLIEQGTSVTEREVLSKREAYEKLLHICERQGEELNQFLLDLEGHLDAEDFKQIRLIVGGVMGQGHYDALVAISNEIPELTPQWVKDRQS